MFWGLGFFLFALIFLGWGVFTFFFTAACAIATVNKVLKQLPNFQDVPVHKQKLLWGLIRSLNFSLKKTEKKKPYEELPTGLYKEEKEASLKTKCPSAELAGGCVTAVYVPADFLLNDACVSEALG